MKLFVCILFSYQITLAWWLSQLWPLWQERPVFERGGNMGRRKHYIEENHNISGITSKVYMQPAVMIKVINKGHLPKHDVKETLKLKLMQLYANMTGQHACIVQHKRALTHLTQLICIYRENHSKCKLCHHLLIKNQGCMSFSQYFTLESIWGYQKIFIRVWNNMRESKRWQKVRFGVNYLFNRFSKKHSNLRRTQKQF